MGYRPDDQSLEKPLNRIIEVLDSALPELEKVINNRAESREWKDSHIEELNQIIIDVFKLKILLKRIESENW